MQATGKYYVINHLAILTGLSDRTIRSYIASGILQGEIIDGLWHFTPEQVETFVCHPAVRPSISAKNNGFIYDFLLENQKTKQEACVILDIPYEDKKAAAEFFHYRISNRDDCNVQFSFDGVMKTSRVILKGNAEEVLQLLNEYHSKFAE